MTDPVVLEPNEIPLSPRVGEKVETEEQNDILIKVEEVSQAAASGGKSQEHVDGLSETASKANLENNSGNLETEVHSVDDQPAEGDTQGTEDQSHSDDKSQERSGKESGTEGYSTQSEDSGGERHSSKAESLTDYSSSEEEDTDDEGEEIEEEEEEEEEEEGEVEVEEEEVGNTKEGKQEKQKEEKEDTNEWNDEESRREKEEMIEMRERGDGQEAEEQKSNPAFIPRRSAFWGHDDRWTDTLQDERRKPTNRKLWDRTADQWQHDMYREEEQGPKTQEELEETERMLARRGGRPGRRRYQLQEFVQRGERRGQRGGRGGGRVDSRQIGDSNEEENRESKENKPPRSRLGSDWKRFDEEQGKKESKEGGERIRGGFARREGRQRRWQNSREDEEWPSLGYDERRKTDRRRVLKSDAYYDDEVQDNSDRYHRLKDTSNGRRGFDSRQRHGNSRRRDDHRDGINDHEGSRELRRREGQKGDARERHGERDRVFDEGGKTRNEKKGPRQRHQDDTQEKLNQESGGFGSPRQDRNAQDTSDRRPRRGDTLPSTEVQANAIPSTSTHSYTKLRGRGRGRGQTQELKKPRKNAADFTREREEARKKEEQQNKQAEEENFEDAEGEEEDVIVEEDYGEGEDGEENAENDEKEDVEEGFDEVVEEEQVQYESKQNGKEQTKPGQKLADKKIKQTVSSTQQNPPPSQSISASKPKRYSSQRQRVTQQMPLPIHQQQVVASIGTMYPDQAFYDQMAYQGIYVPSGTPSSQSMPLMPQHPEVLIQQDMSTTPGEQAEMTAGIAMPASGPQPMGALQHETLMHQQLAALHQGAVAAQQNMAPEGMSHQRVPQHGMSPQQQQVLAAHLQMQAQQGAAMMPVPQGNMNPQSSAGFVSNMNVQHPHHSGVQTFTGQPLMYNNSQFPVMNVGLNPFVSQQMYGLPLQGGGAFYPPSSALIGQQQQPHQQQQQPPLEQSQQMQTRRRPTAAITIKSPLERV